MRLPLFQTKVEHLSAVFPFLAALMFIETADIIMSYVFPIFTEESLGSASLLGIVMALSSVAGITCDLLFPSLFSPQTWKKQLVLTILLAVAFPLLTFFGLSAKSFFIFTGAAVIWGIYYELLLFSQQNFVVSRIPRKDFSRVWGLIALILSFPMIIGPILASQLISNYHTLFWTILLFQALALAATFFIKFVSSKHPEAAKSIPHISFVSELRSWRILFPQLSPVVAVGTLTKCVDASFWTIGALYGEYLFKTHKITLGTTLLDESFAWLPITLFQIPPLFASLILVKLGITHHKKYFSEILLLVAGVSLLPFVWIEHTILVLVMILVLGFAIALSFPLNQAVYSDLIKRAHGYEEDIVGISQANSSIAYIVAPLLAGFSVDILGYSWTFTLLGAVLVIAAVILLVVTPRKIHLPQKAMIGLT